MDKTRAQRLLQPFVPTGYDIYVLGVQDCCSESVFECLSALLQLEGCRRLAVDSDACIGTEGNKAHSSSFGQPEGAKVYGRGDGSLLSTKFTGMAIFVRSSLLGDVSVLATASHSLSASSSRGAVAVALSVLGRTVAFVSCHLDAKQVDKRREHFQQIVAALGSQLGESGFHLNEQFHHIVWFGDLNYRLVDTSGNAMPVESAVKMLEDKRLCRTLYESHDELLRERKAQNVFYGFREPVPFPNFYPTYKKIEGRNPVDYTDPSWVRHTYRIQQKQPFYKGGTVKDSVPGFCDRVLYHSIADLAEDLLPECVPTDMLVSSQTSFTLPGETAAANRAYPTAVNFTVDNYRSVNDGEAMTISDHSPVFATFLLRVRHDFEKLLREADEQRTSEAGIQTVFSALGLSDHTLSQQPSVRRPSASTTNTISTSSSSSSAANLESRSAPCTVSTNRDDSPSQYSEATDIKNSSKDKPLFRYSLLAAGVWYRVRVTGLKLLWGTNDEVPRYVSVMFPAPFEVPNPYPFEILAILILNNVLSIEGFCWREVCGLHFRSRDFRAGNFESPSRRIEKDCSSVEEGRSV